MKDATSGMISCQPKTATFSPATSGWIRWTIRSKRAGSRTITPLWVAWSFAIPYSSRAKRRGTWTRYPSVSGVPMANTPFTRGYKAGETIRIPVAHHDGNFQADAETLDRLEQQGQVAFRYAEEVNGSARQIAGILNAKGNVLGMMPHPERVVEKAHGSTDGRALFEGLLNVLA